MAGSRPVIELDRVSFGYGAETVVDQVSLTVEKRDFLAIVGPNGGGKTTLLLLILGLLRPWSGGVHLRLSPRTGAVGYVPQFASFDRSFPLRVREVVLMGCLGRRRPLRPYNRQDHEAVLEALHRFALQEVAQAPIGEISGGQLQRVLLARALVGRPELLLMDEPLASIDAPSRRLLLDTLREQNKKIPVIMVTHHLGFLGDVVKRTLQMNRRLTEESESAAAPVPGSAEPG